MSLISESIVRRFACTRPVSCEVCRCGTEFIISIAFHSQYMSPPGPSSVGSGERSFQFEMRVCFSGVMCSFGRARPDAGSYLFVVIGVAMDSGACMHCERTLYVSLECCGLPPV